LCETYGVSGYPTIKYFKKGGDAKGDSYEGGRDFKELKKFVTQMSKKPCDPSTLENCNKKDKGYLEDIKDWDQAKVKEEHDKMAEAIKIKRQEKEELDALFDKQKTEAIATQKQGDEAKKALGKFNDKTDYKIAILNGKLAGKKDL